MPKRAVFERSRRELSLDVSVGVHILLVVEQSSLEIQSRGCANTPIPLNCILQCLLASFFIRESFSSASFVPLGTFELVHAAFDPLCCGVLWCVDAVAFRFLCGYVCVSFHGRRFWKRGMRFRSTKFESLEARNAEAKQIYDAFLAVDAKDQAMFILFLK